MTAHPHTDQALLDQATIDSYDEIRQWALQDTRPSTFAADAPHPIFGRMAGARRNSSLDEPAVTVNARCGPCPNGAGRPPSPPRSTNGETPAAAGTGPGA